MNIQEALLFADEIVFKETGKHLDDIQLGLIEGVLQRKKYSEIAKDLNCTEGYLKDMGYELWKLFSQFFEEDVNKSNLRSSLLRHSVTNNINVFGNVSKGGTIGQLNVCPSQENLAESTPRQELLTKDVIQRLRKVGLDDQQIAECLNISLEEFEKS